MNAPSPNQQLVAASPLIKRWSCDSAITQYSPDFCFERCRHFLQAHEDRIFRSKTVHQTHKNLKKIRTHKQTRANVIVTNKENLPSTAALTKCSQQKPLQKSSNTIHLLPTSDRRRQLSSGLTTLNSLCSSQTGLQAESTCLQEKSNPPVLMSSLAFTSSRDISSGWSGSSQQILPLVEEKSTASPHTAPNLLVSGSARCVQDEGLPPPGRADSSYSMAGLLIPAAVLQPVLLPLDSPHLAAYPAWADMHNAHCGMLITECQQRRCPLTSSAASSAWVSSVAAAVSAREYTVSCLNFIPLIVTANRADTSGMPSVPSVLPTERSDSRSEEGSATSTSGMSLAQSHTAGTSHTQSETAGSSYRQSQSTGTLYTQSQSCTASLAQYIFSLKQEASPDCTSSPGHEHVFDGVLHCYGRIPRENHCTHSSSVFPKKRGRQYRKAESDCGVYFPDENDVHTDNITSSVLMTKTRNVSRNNSPSCHKCPDCQLQFSRASDLSSHLLNHSVTGVGSGARNKCVVCSRVFTRSWLLKGHMRTHTGERPFHCSFPQCNKAFADKSNLRSHTLIHTTSSKSFVCPKCGRAFSQKRYLHKHMLEVCRIIWNHHPA